MKMTENKISIELAEQEFKRFADLWDIDVNTEDMNDEDKTSFVSAKRPIIRAIMNGIATVDEEGNLSYTIKDQPNYNGPETITFHVPDGAAYMAMDRHKDRESVHKLFSFMAASSKQQAKVFSSMRGGNIKFCMGVALLFLGS